MGFYSELSKHYNDIFPVAEGKVAFISDRLPSDRPSSLLDVGCANGGFSFALWDRIDYRGMTCRITAIDLDKSMIDTASRHKDAEGYKELVFEAIDMLNLDEHFEPSTFDVITCFGNTLVHLHKDEVGEFLALAKKLLRSGGVLVFQILNYDYVYSAGISELPLIENEKIRFDRHYDLESRKSLKFSVKLTDKSDGSVYKDSLVLYPLFREDVTELLKDAGFENHKFYSAYDGSYSEDKLPFIVEAW